MPEPTFLDAGTLSLNSQDYRIVRAQGQLAFNKEYVSEPPYSQGVPESVSEPQTTWHLGGFKSRQGVAGTSEYGINSDGRWPFRLLPGPYQFTLELPGSVSTPTWAWDGAYVAAGSILYTAGLLGVLPIADFSPATIVMGLSWNGVQYVVTSAHELWGSGGLTTSEKKPNAVGSFADFTRSGGADNYEMVDDAVADDDATYNVSSTSGHKDSFNFPTFAIPAGETPQYALVNVRFRRTSASGSPPIIKAFCKSGAATETASLTTILGASLDNIMDTDWHDGFAFFKLNPDGDVPWTPTTLDAAEFGYELTTAPGAGGVRVTYNPVSTVSLAFDQSGDVEVDWLAKGPRRLFKVHESGNQTILKNIPLDDALDPLVEGDYGDEIHFNGLLSGTPPMVPYQNTVFVSTDKGFYGVDSEDGREASLIQRMTTGARALYVWDPWVLVAHDHGLFRFVPGTVEAVGLEQEIMNESPVKGIIRAMSSVGPWLYAALTPDANGNHNIIVGRDRRPNEPGFGPMIWDTFVINDEDTALTFLHSATVLSQYVLAFPAGNNINYLIMPTTGGAPEVDSSLYRFVLAAERYSPKYRYDDWEQKDFYKIRIRSQNTELNARYWKVSYRTSDLGGWLDLDLDGQEMRAQDGTQEFVLPAAAVGQEIQYKFSYVSNTNEQAASIIYWEPYARTVSQKLGAVSMQLRLEANLQHDSGRDTRTAEEQYSDLEALLEFVPALTASGPFGEDILCSLRDLKVVKTEQETSGEYQMVVQITLQVRRT